MRTIYLQEDLKILSSELEKRKFGNSTILVTGATGLIGSLCIKAITEYNRQHIDKIKIVALARNPEKVKSIFSDEMENDLLENVNFIYQDISEYLPVSLTCDYLIHTANSTTSKYFMTNPVEVIDSIYTGTKRILDFAFKKNVKGMVYLSSMEVFGIVDSEDRISEEQLGYIDIQNIRSCYSEGKRLAELLCKSYACEYKLPVKTARLAQTFGAGVPKTENRVFAQFARNAISGDNIVLHTMGRSVGNYCYTRDAIKALFLLLQEGENGYAYTVVNEETTRTIAEMAQMVAKEFSHGKSKVVFEIPEGNRFGYAPDTKMHLSSKKIRELGWQPEIPLVEMYRRMLPDL